MNQKRGRRESTTLMYVCMHASMHAYGQNHKNSSNSCKYRIEFRALMYAGGKLLACCEIDSADIRRGLKADGDSIHSFKNFLTADHMCGMHVYVHAPTLSK